MLSDEKVYHVACSADDLGHDDFASAELSPLIRVGQSNCFFNFSILVQLWPEPFNFI